MTHALSKKSFLGGQTKKVESNLSMAYELGKFYEIIPKTECFGHFGGGFSLYKRRFLCTSARLL